MSASGGVSADDWPQWMGPERDNIWKEKGIVQQFPESGVPVLWQSDVAGGYAGPAVADGRVFITDYVSSEDVQVSNFERQTFTGIERVHCLDQQTGKTIWSYQYPVNYTVSYPAGPRCTPNVDGQQLYTLGTEGHLICFNAADGRVIWSKHLPTDYNTKTPLWGYAAHPLVDGNKLITLVGGNGTHAVAFDKLSGQEIWRTITASEQGYSPPTIIQAGGKRQLILARPDGISGVDPETGKVYWTEPYQATNGSIIMSPVVSGNYLYIAGYSNQNLLMELAQDKPAVKVLWANENRKGISPVNVQPIVDGDKLYGYDQRGTMIGMRIADGERLWENSDAIGGRPAGSDSAFLVRQGERYFLFTEKGDLVIADLTEAGYREIDRTHLIEPTGQAFGRAVVWSVPAYANRSIFVRNDNQLVAFDLSAAASGE
jgi:outer membrane protein assembly factor BamB